MKYCPNCGTQVEEGVAFCPKCGNPMNDARPAQRPNNNFGGHPKVARKEIVTCILLSVVTCGIYGIIWFINMADDINTVCQDEKSSTSGGTVFLLTLVTCGIYGIIFFFNAGKRLAEAGRKYNMPISDNSALYLILLIFGLGIVDYCMIQSDLNKFAG